MTVIGSKRFRVEINLMYMWNLGLGRIGEEMINRLEKHKLLGSLTAESNLVCVSSL